MHTVLSFLAVAVFLLGYPPGCRAKPAIFCDLDSDAAKRQDMTSQNKVEQLRQIQELQQQLEEKVQLKMKHKQKKVEVRQSLLQQLQKEQQVCPGSVLSVLPVHASS